MDENTRLKEENQSLKNRVAWFENQMFGQKSEKRIVENPLQGNLLGVPVITEPEKPAIKKVAEYERGKAKKNRPDDCTTDTGLRFSDEVPVEVINITPPELIGSDADQYKIIDIKITRKLAKLPASYVVLEYHLPVIKKIDSGDVRTTRMPDQVLDSSIADVSLLVGLLIDKFLYHNPLHRQHQKLTHAGITVARSSLTNWVKRSIELLRPIVQAMLNHVLKSKVLAMDETPIKAGRKHQGKMKQAYFWPVYGEDHEVVFTFSESRGQQHIIDTLNHKFSGTLVTDGYAAYARYAEKTDGIIHAQCWVHSRRYLVNAEESSPQEVAVVLEIIGQLYQFEKRIVETKLSGDKKRQYRLENSKPLVDEVFSWLDEQCQRHDLTPKHPLTKAINYLQARETELRVFLADPDVPMDTNHLEREIRPIPLGKKNWMFCWTELGAEHVGLIQSLISTCKLHDINPHTYLTDVLQRVSCHPASKVEELTPRVWKEKFADEPMRSVIYKTVNDVVE
ncbi:Transposase, IS66 family [Oleispira antarctica RB-8]|uniref:Transposase, IS66 family n=1 Tax=Oleispira antarctica RB-8 TaxID=698738 RepID=R4YUH4_OLEAN|nr:Transposase, IS66 family [Oleispira antarctica RB-8]CCK76639.1 Transposase, IS66 family [Oleispira antarctica RB-8]CCK76679.1 Transposase, IS66 family [Oleispira antarctica RB-8]